MTRTWAALAASILAIVLLIALIYSSRPLSTDVYAAHHSRLNAIESSVISYNGLVDQLVAARRSGSGAGSGLRPLQARLENDQRMLAASVRQDARGGGSAWRAYEQQLAAVLATSERSEEQLREFERALRIIREEGPAAVQSLRATQSGPNPQRFYTFLLKTLEFSKPDSAVSASLIKNQADNLRNGDVALPTYMLDLLSAIDSVLAFREPLDTSLAQLKASTFPTAAQTLANEYASQHNAVVRGRNNARLLMSVYSLLLFAGLGFLGWRLQSSYREINDVNDQLQIANEGLELRVQERTRDVQKAYTDLQQSQVQLVQAEKMSSLGQLVAGISHEINTPLLYLQSNATLNKETLDRISSFIAACEEKLLPKFGVNEDKNEARRRFLAGLKDLQRHLVEGEIGEEIREVLALTDDNLEGLEELTQLAQGLKDFSRLDRAPIDSFNVNKGIERTLTIAKNMLKTRVEVSLDLGDVPDVSCAPSQINQVFLNLISNASQAIEGTGNIWIKTSADDEFVKVQIRDDGSGIAPEILEKIRDPFFTTKEVGAGTGLGLSIVEEILGKHGGHLKIESQVGSGSTFSVFLPLSRPHSALEESFERGQSEAGPAGHAASAPRAGDVFDDKDELDLDFTVVPETGMTTTGGQSEPRVALRD